ncbi:glucosaminidase domain-containing protein [Candidatus Sulfurimonas marisnigri]|uniref:Glucosaminidase domain-containing protein n=1 Tax=Candidatus Sulfurimonas marisnigri TaxID=2740405 RepID=A0A7S7RQR8_9BACT|nr:glucosaminidase domain-containing protein [Candidatus Sulfurimonas marisnigri]QOY54914.1 glucosaminidase domain-containing protein [Candidatus Sulfurimonas marisnigri]
MKRNLQNLILIALLPLLIFFIYDAGEPEEVSTDTVKAKIAEKKIAEKKIVTKEQIVEQTDVRNKKELFLDLIVPAVDLVYDELDLQYKETINLLENNSSIEKILELKQMYKVTSDEELLMALKPHPKSIAISQAAMESAWITSRFYKEANNLFGVWSFNKHEPRIAALEKRGDKKVWLKKYSTVVDSVRDYYITLARSSAFKEFRELKMKTDDPYKLVKELDDYSELGEKYPKQLSSMIKYNKFYLYDE